VGRKTINGFFGQIARASNSKSVEWTVAQDHFLYFLHFVKSSCPFNNGLQWNCLLIKEKI